MKEQRAKAVVFSSGSSEAAYKLSMHVQVIFLKKVHQQETSKR